MFLAPRILELAHADKDGRLRPEEAAWAAERFIRDADRDKKGSLDEDGLIGAMNRQKGPPPGFGPGGPMGQERELVKAFDKDGDGRLNQRERRGPRIPDQRTHRLSIMSWFQPERRGRGRRSTSPIGCASDPDARRPVLSPSSMGWRGSITSSSPAMCDNAPAGE